MRVTPVEPLAATGEFRHVVHALAAERSYEIIELLRVQRVVVFKRVSRPHHMAPVMHGELHASEIPLYGAFYRVSADFVVKKRHKVAEFYPALVLPADGFEYAVNFRFLFLIRLKFALYGSEVRDASRAGT